MLTSVRAAVAAILVAGAAGVAFVATSAEPVEARQTPAAPIKIAIINSRAILAEAPGRAAAQSVFEREMEVLRAEIKRMGDSLDAMVKAYEAVEATLSPPAREQRRKAIQDRQVSFEARRDTLSQRADRRQGELMQPILDMVNKVIMDVRDQNAYSVILDIGADGHGIVAYDKNLDITDRVLTLVRRQQAPPTPGAATPPRRDTLGTPPRR
jgi:Skp family chaperone for outer membrane proteins